MGEKETCLDSESNKKETIKSTDDELALKEQSIEEPPAMFNKQMQSQNKINEMMYSVNAFR